MEKYMLVHTSHGQLHKKYPHCPKQVPMGLLSEKQAQTNHGQSLDKLNKRGGLDPIELICNIEKRKYPWNEEINEEEYIQKLIQYIDNYKSKKAMTENNLPGPPPQKPQQHSVCKMRNSKCKIVYRILTKELADKWKEEQEFTGSHEECGNYMVEHNINNLDGE